MKIGFLIFRLANLKGLGSLITLSLQRDHEVAIFVDPTSKPKLGEAVDQGALAEIWPNAQVVDLQTESTPQGLADANCNAIVGMAILTAEEYRGRLDTARENGALLFSISYLFEGPGRDPSLMASLGKAFYLSEYERTVHESLFPQSFNSLGSDWKQKYTEISGSTCCDQLAEFDSRKTRHRYGISETSPVVLFMSLKMSVTDTWRNLVWGESSKTRRTLKAIKGRHWRLIPEIWTQDTYKEICNELKEFCIRNGALFVVKSRTKNDDPLWLRELSDVYVGQDETEYPYTSIQLIGISNLCVHFESAAVFETAFAGVPSLSINIPQPSLYEQLPEYSTRYRSKELGSLFNYPGVITSIDCSKIVEHLRRADLKDFAMEPSQRSKYVSAFMGFDDMRSSVRILDSMESSLRDSSIHIDGIANPL